MNSNTLMVIFLLLILYLIACVFVWSTLFFIWRDKKRREQTRPYVRIDDTLIINETLYKIKSVNKNTVTIERQSTNAASDAPIEVTIL